MEILAGYDSVSELKRFLDENGFAMRKRFGQNFLVSPGGRSKILRAMNLKGGECVWEIGPGLGALTHELVKKAGRLTVFEIDRGFIRYLQKAFGGEDGFTVVEGDAVKSWKSLAAENPPPDRIVGNLPYSAASAIISGFLESGFMAEKMVFTVQKEMGERMYAQPGSKSYSSFSMLCQFRCTIQDHGDLKPGSFYPQPEVTSKIVGMTPHDTYRNINDKLFFMFISDLFLSRRKKIRNNILRGKLGRIFSADIILSALEAASIDPDDRGENVDTAKAAAAVKMLQQSADFSG